MPIARLVRLVAVLMVLSAGLPLAGQVQAARLGPLSVLSERGQPLRAEVEVEEPASGEGANGEPAIVSADTYRDLGLSFPAALRGASVTMTRRESDGRPLIRIQGRTPTDSPEVIVVMSLSTPAGRHLRSYRLDLDAPPAGGAPRASPPPPAADAPAAPRRDVAGAAAMPPLTLTPEPARIEPPRDVPRVEALPSQPPAAVALPSATLPSASTPSMAAPSAQMPATPAPPPAASSGPSSAAASSRPQAQGPRAAEPTRAAPATVTIARGDTAASIVNPIRPADVTEAQAVMALHRNNASAFAGSVYRPRVGASVRLPDADQMRAVPPGIAEQALRAQSQQGARAQTAATASAPMASTVRGDRLKLTTGGTGRGKQQDAKGGTAGRAIAFDAAMTEARSRIQQLESIVQSLNQLIAERDKQIADLSNQLKVSGVAVAPAATPVGATPVAPAASAPGVSVPGPGPTAPNAAGMPVPNEPPVAAAPAPAPTPAPSEAAPPLGAAAATMLPEPTRRRPPAPVPEPEPEPWYTDPMLLGAAGVVVVLLVLTVMYKRFSSGKRKRATTGRFASAR